MKFHFLGTGAGTEPLYGVYHQSLALEINKNIYFFDCGEGCSRRAHLKGLDILKTKAVFVSHTHMDHVGGLGNLLWNMRKLHSNNGYQSFVCPKSVYVPNLEIYDAIINENHKIKNESKKLISMRKRNIEYMDYINSKMFSSNEKFSKQNDESKNH